MRISESEYVREQYLSTDKLDARISVWQPLSQGESPQDIALSALQQINPQTLLDVGSGTGAFGARCARELGCRVIAIDSSEAMVAASISAGLDASVGDVLDLPFANDSFDAVIAAWMLYHVADVEKAVFELARVLKPGGRLIAITNGQKHLAELWDFAGLDRLELSFSRENGETVLSRHFESVARLDVSSRAIFRDRGAAANYLNSLHHEAAAEQLPDFCSPLVAQGTPTVFIADRSKQSSGVL